MTTMPKTREEWIASLGPRLEQGGSSWERLSGACEQLVIFGSRAAGVPNEDSDFDLLCVGPGASRLSRTLDLVFIAPEDLLGERWLGSELAGHVARYGIWLKGEPDWVHRHHGSHQAVERKRQKLLHRLQAVEQHFHLLDPLYLQKYLTLTRRDLQRFEHLTNGEPVPPTPILDRAWAQLGNPGAKLWALAREASVGSPFLLERLSVPERWPVSPGPQRLQGWD